MEFRVNNRCPCIECITLAICKAKFIDRRRLWPISSYCKLLEDFLMEDVIPDDRGVTYWMFRENRERKVKEILTGKSYGYKEKE